MKNSILTTPTLFLFSCAPCPPAQKVKDGSAPQKWERSHKFRATYQRKGNYYLVRLENNFEIIKIKTPYKPNFHSGDWILCRQL